MKVWKNIYFMNNVKKLERKVREKEIRAAYCWNFTLPYLPYLSFCTIPFFAFPFFFFSDISFLPISFFWPGLSSFLSFLSFWYLFSQSNFQTSFYLSPLPSIYFIKLEFAFPTSPLYISMYIWCVCVCV